jgi:hypothetical protein
MSLRAAARLYWCTTCSSADVDAAGSEFQRGVFERGDVEKVLDQRMHLVERDVNRILDDAGVFVPGHIQVQFLNGQIQVRERVFQVVRGDAEKVLAQLAELL